MAEPRDSQYVGWGGKTKHVAVDLNLGMGTHRGHPSYGIHRAIWAAAMGYVSGFDKRDILYYVLTRTLCRRFEVWAMKREGIEFRNGLAVARRSNG
jgi:hypothetical protein